MQVQKIQNNNNYNTNFGAKLQLEGDIKDLPKELIKEFKIYTKAIGKDTDIVSIDIGSMRKNTETRSEMGQRFEATDYYREHNVASYVNGKLKQHRIETDADINDKNDMENIRKSIIKYLEQLILKS